MRKNKLHQACRTVTRGSALISVPFFIALAATSGGVNAASFNTGHPDLSVRWDNTLKYSNAFRVKNRSNKILTGNANGDDGDQNFDRGLVSNRFDVLSEIDVVYKNYGFRTSGAAWYDTVYNKSNDNDSPGTVNHFGRHDKFSSKTRKLHGRDAELLDLFVTGYWEIGDSSVNVRAGRHAHLWGESLFLGANGIAGAMAPVDVVKITSVPGTQFREAIRPVNQISSEFQFNEYLSFAAFYQFEWEENRLPGQGSYLASVDLLGKGSNMVHAGPLGYFTRDSDVDAKDSGQGGVAVMFRPPNSNIDFGLYAIRFHSKSPQTVSNMDVVFGPNPGPPTLTPQGYRMVYHENIDLFGASASTVIGNASVGFEVSTRRNTNLVSQTDAAAPGSKDRDAHGNAPYPVGNTAHAQVSWLYSAGPNWLSQEGTFVGEVAWNRVLSVTKNAAMIDSTTSRDAVGLVVGYTPQYRQVMPGLDLAVPVTIGYNPVGQSAAIASFNGGVKDGGVYSIGVDGTYRGNLNFSLAYTGFIGSAGPGTTPNPDDPNTQEFSFKQGLRDRDFVSFTVNRTF